MKNRFSLKIALVLVVLGIIGWLAFIHFQNSRQTGLQVKTGDQTVNVWLDGEFLGPTPFSYNQISPGSHVLLLQPVAAEYLSFERTINLAPGFLTAVEWYPATNANRAWGIFYEPQALTEGNKNDHSQLVVTSAPDNVVVRLNDGDPKVTPQTWDPLVESTYHLNFSLPSHESLSREVVLTPRTQLNVFVKLAKADESLLQAPIEEENPLDFDSQLRPPPTGQVAGATMRVLSTGIFQDRREVLTIRTQPDANSAAALTVAVGSQLTYLGDQQNGFYKVQAGQRTGWAEAKSLRFQ